MSEDKIKEQLKTVNPKDVQVVYEQYQKTKFDHWTDKSKKAKPQPVPGTQDEHTPGTDTREDEQKAFETYLSEQDFYKAPKSIIFNNLDNFDECVTKGSGVYRVGTQTYGKPSAVGGGKAPVNAGETGVVEVMFENTENRGREQVIQRFTSVASGRTFVRTYAKYGGDRDWKPWKELGEGASLPKGLKPLKMTNATTNNTFDELVAIATGSRKKIYVDQSQDYDVDSFVIINVPKGKVSGRPDLTVTIYGVVKQGKGLTGDILIDGKGYSIGIDTYTRKEIDNAIAQSGAGGGQGGASMNYISLPTGDRSSSWTKTEYGDFAVNLIDYRRLSAKSGKLGTVGSHIKVMDSKDKIVQIKPQPHVIKTKYKSKIESFTKDTYGGSIGLSGIKEGKKLLMNTNWYRLPKTKEDAHRTGSFKLSLLLDDYKTSTLVSRQEDVSFSSTNVTQSANRTPDTIGRYTLDLGSNGDAENFALNFHAFYSKNADSNPLIPHTLDRSFVFKNYNGHELRASYDLADEYKEHALGNVLIRNVGRVKLKDLNWYEATEINPDSQHFVYAKVPDDCKVPRDERDDTGMKELGGKLLTNNLSEVRAEDTSGHGTQSHLEVLKYDTNPPMLEKIIQIVPKQGIKDEWCFVLISNPSNAKRYRDLLSETEILYELKTPEVIYLKEGGYAVHLANGNTLYTHDFFEVKDVKAQDSYFFRYNSNGQGIKVHKSQIVGISPVNEI